METPSKKDKFDSSNLHISLNNLVIHDSITPNKSKVVAMKSSRSFDISPEHINSSYIEDKTTQRISRRSYRKKILIILIFILLTSSLLGVFFYSKEKAKQDIIKEKNFKIAILPFRNISPNPESDYLSQYLSDDLNQRLAKYPTVNIISTTELQQNQHTEENFPALARELKVDKLINGSYRVEDGKIIVNIGVYSGLSEIQPVLETFSKPIDKINEINREASQSFSWTFDLEFEDAIPLTKELELNNPITYETYISGMKSFSDLDKSIEYLNQVVKEEPDFSLGWVGLFNAYYRKGTGGCGVVCYDEAIRAIEKATKIDPNNLRIKNAFAAVLTERNRVEEAIEMMLKVLAENPNSKEAFNSLSYSYRYVGLLEESIKMTKASINYNNSSPDNSIVVNSLLYLGRNEEFRAFLNKPTTKIYARFFLGFLEFHEKHFDKAKEDFQFIIQFQPTHMLSKLGKVYVYYIDNNPKEGLKILNEIKSDIYLNEVYDGEMIYKIAQAFSVLNDKKSATELFQLSVEKGFFCYPYFLTDPLMENVRKEPNFEITLRIAKARQDEVKSHFSLALN